MRAVCWQGKYDVRIGNVPDPKILNPRDVILKVTSTAICGSDLHLYAKSIPGMESGDILGHEFMGEVIEAGAEVKKLRSGDRVIVPFCIACGGCRFCKLGLTSCCDNTNPNATVVEKLYGFSGAGLYGYSHLYGGYAGGQAEYVRVAQADANAFKVPGSLPDEKVLFLTDIFPTGFMAAENCNIHPGDVVAVWGAGPVGLLAMASASLLGAGQIIAIDREPARLALAMEKAGATHRIDMTQEDVFETLLEITAGRGPDSCIDAVGMDAHGVTIDEYYDRAKRAVMLATDKASALRQAIHCCRKGGTVSVPGVYGGFIDKLPFGAAFGKGLTLRMGQTHVHKYVPRLLEHIEAGEIDPSFVITHRVPLSKAPELYETFRKKQDACIKVVLNPAA